MADMSATHEPREARGLVRHYLRDLIYGANDGIITTFAIVTGVTGAALQPRVVLILGVANLLADGFSMGASNFLSIRSDEAARRAEGADAIEPFPLRHGAVTFVAFVLAGAVPLVSYVLDLGDAAFAVAITLTGLTLFVVGAARVVVTDARWWRSGLEMTAIGATAAAVAYGVGAVIARLTV